MSRLGGERKEWTKTSECRGLGWSGYGSMGLQYQIDANFPPSILRPLLILSNLELGQNRQDSNNSLIIILSYAPHLLDLSSSFLSSQSSLLRVPRDSLLRAGIQCPFSKLDLSKLCSRSSSMRDPVLRFLLPHVNVTLAVTRRSTNTNKHPARLLSELARRPGTFAALFFFFTSPVTHSSEFYPHHPIEPDYISLSFVLFKSFLYRIVAPYN